VLVTDARRSGPRYPPIKVKISSALRTCDMVLAFYPLSGVQYSGMLPSFLKAQNLMTAKSSLDNLWGFQGNRF